MKEFHISVRNLVEFIFREGDIDNRRGQANTAEAMQEGTRIHRKIQGEQGESYMAEVPLKYEIALGEYSLTIEGRADGIFTEIDTDGDEHTFIDEIKGMYANVKLMEEPIFVHKAQAMCYAYIVAMENELSEIGIQMTYCNLESEERKYFREILSYEDLTTWFLSLLKEYKKWSDFQYEWRKIRQESIKQLDFPFTYREGQKKLVGDVYRTIARQKNLFIQAPTGVGKTISTIYPAVKAVGEELADRIFYLTAKTITATVARETFSILMEQGYRAKIIQLTAKEKMCLCQEMECNPVHCPYAKGHFDRVNDAVYDLLQKSNLFTRDEIIAQAKEYTVCPFELSLDVASWVDDIVCDYNYAFDPTVYLKRFFSEGIKGDYIFLVDEAHNLVERSRGMYSAQICKEDFLLMKKLIKPYSKKLEKLLDKCNKLLLEMKRECAGYVIYEEIGTMLYSLMRTATELDEFLQKNMEFAGKKELLEFYFSLRNFLNIYELVDEHYVIYTEIGEDGRFALKLFCVDPSLNLQNCLNRAKSTIFFSATFLPIHYYKRLLSTKEDNYAIYAESTFQKEQSLLAIGTDVSTVYKRRGPKEYEKIAVYIKKILMHKEGNYMVFFPSYRFMEDVFDAFLARGEKIREEEEVGSVRLSLEGHQVCCLMQKAGMKELEREEFLVEFEKAREGSLVAFCVMGGIFGEGIDLTNDKLIGAIVVGTGIPQISNEREILKNYYEKRGEDGFAYAFRYPGMNKVLQAAGRVIRTQEDKGVILLLDERFMQRDYEGLFPREWEHRKTCNQNTVEALVQEFWSTK